LDFNVAFLEHGLGLQIHNISYYPSKVLLVFLATDVYIAQGIGPRWWRHVDRIEHFLESMQRKITNMHKNTAIRSTEIT
jgi:hypothetical protein